MTVLAHVDPVLKKENIPEQNKLFLPSFMDFWSREWVPRFERPGFFPRFKSLPSGNPLLCLF